jgi:hypothetical protein
MTPNLFLHERSGFADLIRIADAERGLLPALVEKDYWIMHCLYGLAAQNFMRHYYDISQLLEYPNVTNFIGTPKYQTRKKVRFRMGANLHISENKAFLLSDPVTRNQYALAYQATASLYFNDQIPFDTILRKIQAQIDKL